MPAVSRIGKLLAHNLHGSAIAGGLLGAGANVAREATGDGDKNYLGAAIRGGLGGAALGAASGGIARAVNDTRLLNPQLSGIGATARATAQRAAEGIGNFAKRQAHGLTGVGAKDTAHLDRIGIAGAKPSADKARLLNLRADDAVRLNPKREASIYDAANKQIRGVIDEGDVGEKMRSAGLTSIPGVAKGLVQNPRESAKALWNHARQGGKAGVALGVGLPVAIGTADIAKGDESAAGGKTVGGKLLQHGANIGTGFAFAGLPIASQMIAGMGVDAATNRMTRRTALPASV